MFIFSHFFSPFLKKKKKGKREKERERKIALLGKFLLSYDTKYFEAISSFSPGQKSFPSLPLGEEERIQKKHQTLFVSNKVFSFPFSTLFHSFSSSFPSQVKGKKKQKKSSIKFRFSPPFPLPQKRSRRKEFSFLLISIPSSFTRRKNEKENLYPISFPLLYLFQKQKKWLYS